MKNSFSKEDKEFQEMIMRAAANQDLYGAGVTNEMAQDVVEDQFGYRKILSSNGTMIKTGPDGMPFVLRERVGKVLDCGHMVYSLEGYLGQCINGHEVCTRCQLHICDWCGVQVCDKCLTIYKDGTKTCGKHPFRAFNKFLTG